MTNTITLTDDQLADLNAGKSITIHPEKWQPKGGEYWINSDFSGIIKGRYDATPSISYVSAGMERDRKDHAARAAKKLRQYARLLAWRDEHCPDYVEPDTGECAEDDSYVFFGNFSNEWGATQARVSELLAVTMPRWAAEQLAHDLNAGKVEL